MKNSIKKVMVIFWLPLVGVVMLLIPGLIWSRQPTQFIDLTYMSVMIVLFFIGVSTIMNAFGYLLIKFFIKSEKWYVLALISPVTASLLWIAYWMITR